MIAAFRQEKCQKIQDLADLCAQRTQPETCGTREPEVYGTTTLAEIDRRLRPARPTVSRPTFRRTPEGVLVDWIQECRTKGCGLILNAGALTTHQLRSTTPVVRIASDYRGAFVQSLLPRTFPSSLLYQRGANGVICD